ncbi:MAG: bifunctional diguanylate cyclase/phosphodiesterase [Lachnospiraceae bacterium]|nr:bifunctional diguanylate cyclase/phosphodiesterase [Lachnospiraceae bacterium]
MYLRKEVGGETQQNQNTNEYFEKGKMQKMQDAFCKANHLYCVCIGRDLTQITEFSGGAEEESYLNTLLTPEMKSELIHSFSDVEGENVIAMPTNSPFFMLRGVAIRGEGYRFMGAWMVLGIDAEQVPEDAYIPRSVMTTTREALDKAIALLEVLTNTYFTNKSQLAILEEDLIAMEKEERRMEYLLQKTEVLTEILKFMESEEPFAQVIDDILSETGKYLGNSNCELLKITPDEETVELVCEWADTEEHLIGERIKGMKQSDFPFMTGRTYTISSDTIVPEPFMEYFAAYGIRCGAFLPININGKTGMYLCITMMDADRKWSVEDIRFINDIKRVVQTILIKRVTKNSLASSYSALESILENTGCGVSVIDLQKATVLYTNDTYKNLSMKPEERATLEELFLKEQDDLAEEFYAEESGKWYELSFSSMEWVDGRQVRLVTIYDVSKTKQYQEKIEHQANTDYLTGLYNRMRLEEDLKEEIHTTVRSGGQSGILVINLDDFDNINDGLGHQAGDILLRNVAESLQRIDGISNCCYRAGGDEFIILIHNSQMDRMDTIIKRIRQIFSTPWQLDEKSYYCTMSMGVVTIPKDGVDPVLLLQRADIALHTAKSLGKNRVEYYNSEQHNSAVERLDLEKCLREAVEKGCKEFEVYYQPLIDVTKPEKPCCGAEALVRWNSPTMGFVMPSQFIPLAEYLGLINEIGRHVLFEACKRCKYWNDFGHPEYKVNVNLSVVQLMRTDIIDTIREALIATQIEPSNLTLEVTEGLAVNDMFRMQQVLREIKNMGIRVALDDFGTGYSSLNHIRSMPIDVIKIDRCFVQDIGDDVFSDAFVKSVSQLAEALDMNICVEGVEEEKQCHALGEMNVDMIQGYLFDKPLCVDDFERKYLF